MPSNIDIEGKIREFDRKLDKARIRIKRSEDRDAFERVFDKRTVLTLIKLLNNLKIKEIVGIISQGKEANVYLAYSIDDKPLAIKIYKIDNVSAKWMKNYIIGDPRFKKIGKSVDKIIFTWCRKEFRNLKQIYYNGINSPEPRLSKENILIMSYIGDKDGTPAPKLKDSINRIADIEKEMNISINFIKKLYKQAKLVHGDLSEYNILYFEGKQYIIDVSQAVSIHHPKALEFLARDIKNVLRFYKKYITIPEPEKLYYEIIQD
ncbi:MAG: serine protein kinase RIO [Promethearchaeota archaeon]